MPQSGVEIFQNSHYIYKIHSPCRKIHVLQALKLGECGSLKFILHLLACSQMASRVAPLSKKRKQDLLRMWIVGTSEQLSLDNSGTGKTNTERSSEVPHFRTWKKSWSETPYYLQARIVNPNQVFSSSRNWSMLDGVANRKHPHLQLNTKRVASSTSSKKRILFPHYRSSTLQSACTRVASSEWARVNEIVINGLGWLPSTKKISTHRW